jgi:hypothetical protein
VARKGVKGLTLLTTAGAHVFMHVPTSTGTSTSWRTLINMAVGFTGTRVPSKRAVSIGVVKIAVKVEAVVIMMLSGISPCMGQTWD